MVHELRTKIITHLAHILKRQVEKKVNFFILNVSSSSKKHKLYSFLQNAFPRDDKDLLQTDRQ